MIHLACISNDPSFELDPELGKSINLHCFLPLVRKVRDSGSRFIYASSSSVYGIKDGENVTEELAPRAADRLFEFKAMCEDILLKERAPGFTARPPAGDLCGDAPGCGST